MTKEFKKTTEFKKTMKFKRTMNLKRTMNPLENEREVVWLQLSAGQGPKECGWVVAQLTRTLMHDAAKHSIGAEFDVSSKLVQPYKLFFE